MRRIAPWLAIAAGLVLVALPLAYSMFDRTEKAETILDRFTFLTDGDNPERYLDEAVVIRNGSEQLADEALPSLAAEAGITEEALLAQSPGLERAQEDLPAAREFSVRYSAQLEAVQDKFGAVYDIPTASLPLTAVPYMLLAAGLLSVALGIAALIIGSRALLWALVALGVALALGPVALGGIGNATDAEDVRDFAKNGLTTRASGAAQQATSALSGLVAETGEQTIPAISRASGETTAQVDARLAAEYPEAAEFLDAWDTSGARLVLLADSVTESVPAFDSARKLPIAFPLWILIGAGLLMAGSAGIALTRR